MHDCIFCRAFGTLVAVEPIIPESLGLDQVTLEYQVCKGCQRYFGQELEAFVLTQTPVALWRVKAIDLPPPAPSPRSCGVGCDCFLSVEELSSVSRFFLKIGLELVASLDAAGVRQARFDAARNYARFEMGEAWPLFYGVAEQLEGQRWFEPSESGVVECLEYEYELLSVEDDCFLHFSMGGEHWLISLTQRYPELRLREMFPHLELNLLWHPTCPSLTDGREQPAPSRRAS
ncbi:MAG TPA: hypothetical protein VFQ61_24145 [Polyangiaceae bacterium]|nr:hypothetical protein [Polyangiaceae bacterium]